ncbi:MAG TPA: class I SAM-dependent methyltransferase [Pyrinomonadaceae bacterium]|nr:class I SAM-dependent methyltransferase [Pyrinomonadaceae bacterium]
MRGFVPTPDKIVDRMVGKLFAEKPPTASTTLLDPGCGPGAFIAGVLRWCRQNSLEAPQITGYENAPDRYAEAQAQYSLLPSVNLYQQDFLRSRSDPFDYVIGNPPYVPITQLSVAEKTTFRRRFLAARGRFDLYLLFFEQALRLLAPGGRLVFITPEKFLYVKTAEPLRRMLGSYYVKEIELVSEETFGKLVTYPTITTIDKVSAGGKKTIVFLRSGDCRTIRFPEDGSSLQPQVYRNGNSVIKTGVTLADISIRVSCGVATGLDSVFVQKTAAIDDRLRPFALPAISGRDLHTNGSDSIESNKSVLSPYDVNGQLIPLTHLGELGRYLLRPEHRNLLQRRTCAQRKPWHAFHDSFPLPDMLRPKLLCKDITAEPHFWVDPEGRFIPCHSVYYIVPRDPNSLYELRDYLNSPDARTWLQAHCQRAANNFLRLQSAVLKRLPIPHSLIGNRENGTLFQHDYSLPQGNRRDRRSPLPQSPA